MKKVKFGIVGLGRIAAVHARSLLLCKNAELWSVCSRDLSKAQTFSTQHQAKAEVPAFDELDRFLSDPLLDAVIVCSPDGLHVDHLKLALEKKKNVLLEKP